MCFPKERGVLGGKDVWSNARRTFLAPYGGVLLVQHRSPGCRACWARADADADGHAVLLLLQA